VLGLGLGLVSLVPIYICYTHVDRTEFFRFCHEAWKLHFKGSFVSIFSHHWQEDVILQLRLHTEVSNNEFVLIWKFTAEAILHRMFMLLMYHLILPFWMYLHVVTVH